MGKDGLYDADPRLHGIGARTEHANELYRPIADQMPQRTTARWLADLDAADIPAAPMHTLDSVFDDPHLVATGTLASADHPTEGRIREIRPTGVWSRTPPTIRRRAPHLEQATTLTLDWMRSRNLLAD